VTAAEQYRALAAECEARAKRTLLPDYGREWELLASAYRRLADQAEQSGLATTIHEAWVKVGRELLGRGDDEAPGRLEC